MKFITKNELNNLNGEKKLRIIVLILCGHIIWIKTFVMPKQTESRFDRNESISKNIPLIRFYLRIVSA